VKQTPLRSQLCRWEHGNALRLGNTSVGGRSQGQKLLDKDLLMDMSWFENAVLTGAKFSYQILAIRWFIPPFFGYPNECGHFTRNMLRL
jgi:hypothetical protein